MDDYWSEFEEFELEKKYDIEEFIETTAGKIETEFLDFEEYHPAILGRENAEKLYALIRETKPELMVETGVCNGFSSSIILKAMEDSGEGKLFSVDLPVFIDEIKKEDRTGAVIPPDKSSGWVVPDYLRDRWTLKEGDTYQELPRLFQSLTSKVDLFLHDSGHSYETMMFEFALAWRNLKEDHYLLADNIDFSDAFIDFTEAKGLNRYRLGTLGVMTKKEEI
ncbi:MAG: class I SAM-dependent methyltransferase [Candidatus Thermoplasmatota archaeon]|nr:class I SAM-dependent methyltransferase [Candidatus Thermoplasmatota archaeon]